MLLAGQSSFLPYGDKHITVVSKSLYQCPVSSSCLFHGSWITIIAFMDYEVSMPYIGLMSFSRQERSKNMRKEKLCQCPVSGSCLFHALSLNYLGSVILCQCPVSGSCLFHDIPSLKRTLPYFGVNALYRAHVFFHQMRLKHQKYKRRRVSMPCIGLMSFSHDLYLSGHSLFALLCQCPVSGSCLFHFS